MPKTKRETLVAMIVIEMLVQGVYFESESIWGLPFNRNLVRKTFRALIGSSVIRKLGMRGKYHLTDEFLNSMREDITREMPRGMFIRYPDLAVFDVCAIGTWTEGELEVYVRRLKERWLLRAKQAEAPGLTNAQDKTQLFSTS